jgi:beta-xylosidase
LLMQKFPAPSFSAKVTLELMPRSKGDSSGLIVFGYDYAWIGLRQNAGACELVCVSCHQAHRGAVEHLAVAVAAPSDTVVLRVEVNAEALCRFSYQSEDGSFVPFGRAFQASSSKWVGAKFGLFAAAEPGPDDARSSGRAAFSSFVVE